MDVARLVAFTAKEEKSDSRDREGLLACSGNSNGMVSVGTRISAPITSRQSRIRTAADTTSATERSFGCQPKPTREPRAIPRGPDRLRLCEANDKVAFMNDPNNPNKALWEKGDFTRIAARMRESGEALVQQLGITKG